MAHSATMALPPVRMEDPKLLAADCVVICTCCPCLVLQLLLLLLSLPRKLARESKKLVLRKLGKRPRPARQKRALPPGAIVPKEDPTGVPMGIPDAVPGGRGRRGCAIAEAERVLEELYQRGELGFGSFCRGGGGGGGGLEAMAGLPRRALLADDLVCRGGSNARPVRVHYLGPRLQSR